MPKFTLIPIETIKVGVGKKKTTVMRYKYELKQKKYSLEDLVRLRKERGVGNVRKITKEVK